jgi:hypothetical protein
VNRDRMAHASATAAPDFWQKGIDRLDTKLVFSGKRRFQPFLAQAAHNPKRLGNRASVLDCAGRAQRRRRFRTCDPLTNHTEPASVRKRRGASLPAAVQDARAIERRMHGREASWSAPSPRAFVPSETAADIRWLWCARTRRRTVALQDASRTREPAAFAPAPEE